MVLKKITFIALSLLLFFSCSKEKDQQKPVIVIDSPTYLQSFNSIDTLIVRGTVSDDKIIESVHISLRNSNDIPVLSTIIEHPKQSTYTINSLYLFDDIHLASGSYYFDISADDGINTTHLYIDVLINELPKSRNGIVIFDNSVGNTDINMLDNSLNATIFKTITGDFLGGVVNSYDQQIISTGSVTGKVLSLDALNASELWSIPLVNAPPTPYFTSIFYEDRTVYVGFYNGNIRGYGTNGASKFGAQAYSNFYCESGLVHDNMLFTEQAAISNSNVRLVVYWLASGIERQQITINENICGMYALTNDEVILLSNDVSNNGKMSIYTISANAKASPYNIGLGKIDACVEISAGIYLIARNGDLTVLNANNFSTLPYLIGINATHLKYDVFTNELFVINGVNLSVYDYNSKTLKGNYTHSNTILDIEFLYNK